MLRFYSKLSNYKMITLPIKPQSPPTDQFQALVSNIIFFDESALYVNLD